MKRDKNARKSQQNEIEQIKQRPLQEKMQEISQTVRGQKILKKMDKGDTKKLDADQIAAKEAEELQKKRRLLQDKLKSQGKKVDYFERAKRLEEIPLLQKKFADQDQIFWEKQEKERTASAIEERKVAVCTRDRLSRMKDDKDQFLDEIAKQRKTLHEEKFSEFEKLLAEEREKKLAERKIARKEERKLKWEKQKQEEEQLRRAETLRIENEERLAREEKGTQERLEQEIAI